MKDLAIEIHVRYMEDKEYDLPEVADIIATAFIIKEPESIADLTLAVKCIEDCVEHWDQWTAEWKREERDLKGQQRDEDMMRGEI